MEKSTRNFIIVVILGALAFGYSSFKRSDFAGNFLTGFSSEGKRIEAEYIKLKKLPSFDAEELFSGEIINSLKLISQGELVVHFFATWCAPCIEELPKLLLYVSKEKEKKFLLIASKDKKRALLKLFKGRVIPPNCTVVLDTDTSIMDLFGSERVPESYFFDKFAQVRFKVEGTFLWDQY